MSDGQFQLVYNILSFSLASKMASTVILWMRVPAVHKKYQTALLISGLVTFIAAYHYMRIFNSWTEAYSYTRGADGQPSGPHPTGIPFNDAYRYMDWLLTVPMLLMEIVLVMKLSPEEARDKCTSLGVAAALMIVLGYPGELIIEADKLSQRWFYFDVSIMPFLYIVHTLLVGLSEATKSETDATVRALVFRAQWVTVLSWLTYPVVYAFPMIGFSGSHAVVAIQVGYCCSDVISKCGVGLIIYNITAAKSKVEARAALTSAREKLGDIRSSTEAARVEVFRLEQEAEEKRRQSK
jgi:bacteriorhodopsin